MKKEKEEFVYEKNIDSLKGFTKEYDGLTYDQEEALKEVWNGEETESGNKQ